ncbi:MAG: A-macroglobulin complement component [Myxococcaceae bacterium]|nr:A-macroglobulin complement component [Myxococcaceae bacterium]
MLRVTTLAVSALVLSMTTTNDLGGPTRYLTHISTDKPIYKPGDQVLVRGTVLEASAHTPLPGTEAVNLKLRGPKGDVVAQGTVATQDGVWSFSWEVPADTAGGEYTLEATYAWSGHAPAERKFDVRVYRPPRLKSQIVFMRDGYGPGDKVTATLETKRAEGGVPAGAKVTAIARVDGAEAARITAKVDAAGLCTVSFDLPKNIARGEGSLAFAIEDGGVVETATKTLPILLQTVDLTLYPEGGDLIAGLPMRVYFEAKTPAQKPADLAGAVVDDTGAEVARFKSAHEGRGRFDFTPVKGRKYQLKVLEPSGIKTVFPLPDAKAEGATVRALRDVFEPSAAVSLSISSTVAAKVTLMQRERELGFSNVNPGPDRAVSIDPKGADGVLIATVWDQKGTPLAERLVFVQPAKPLSVSLELDQKSYVPAGTVKLKVKTTAQGKPVSAVVGLTVTDDAVLELIEKREQAPQLPVMVYLEDDVKELADAHVYLDPKNPKAGLATDLLLGTQGWRRFALVNLPRFLAQSGDDGRRALAVRIQLRTELEDAMGGGGLNLADGAPGRGMALGAVQGAPRPLAPVPMNAPPPRPAPVAPVQAAPPAPPPVVAEPVAIARQPAERPAASKQQAMMGEAIEEAKAKKRERAVAGRELRAVPASAFVFVREYAHVVRPGRRAGDRVDFAETLYWSAGTKTNDQGEATVTFAINDSVTSFRATAGGFSTGGALGAQSVVFDSVQPFYVEPKLPLEVTEGDVVQLPVAFVNGTSESFEASLSGELLGVSLTRPTKLGPQARVRQVYEVKVPASKKPVDVVLQATAGTYADSVTRQLNVKPKGFPFEKAFGGLVGPKKPAKHAVTIPTSMVPGSLTATATVYPTPLANLTEALARLIQEPYGCFEQTSSTSYPLTMAQQYFTTHTGVDPKLVERSRETLDKGYKRLVGFECSDKGYEWFGENPGHEALSAFGLLHFTDMAKVREVDAKMLTNTRAWLLKQRDGAGGFKRARRALHTWVEDRDSSNAYITWALLESGERDVAKEVANLKEAAPKSKNSYVWALSANALHLFGEKAAAAQLMEKLAAAQQKDGSVGQATQSIVGSGGEALTIEATSLAALAWMREQKFAGNVETAIRYLAEACKGGRYGSTQSTVLALRAIVTYDALRARPKAAGSVKVLVDGQQVGSSVKFDPKTEGAIKLPELSELLTPGEHAITLEMEGGGEMPYALAVKFNAVTPASAKETKVDLVTRLSKGTVAEGETLEAYATVTNLSDTNLPTVVAIVGLPGGLEPRHDQLKELVKKGTVDAYEVLGRDVVLYWRGMEKRQVREVPLSLVAAVPGRYLGPASRAYEYYTDELKKWQEGLAVTVTAK